MPCFFPSFFALLNVFLQRLVIIRLDHGSKRYHKSRKYLLFEQRSAGSTLLEQFLGGAFWITAQSQKMQLVKIFRFL